MTSFVRKIIISIIQWQARMIILRYKPRIVAVTGSVGKTGTKDVIYDVLATFFHVRKSKKSFNSEVGVPLTIIGAPTGWRDLIKWLRNVLKGFWVMVWPFYKYPEWLVLEVGVGKPGDMQELKRWVQPDVVVVTAFGNTPSHVEFFESKEAVWEEEASIIDALKIDGTLILNHDDPRVLDLKEGLPRKVLTFGFSPDADIHIEHYAIEKDTHDNPTGLIFRIGYEGKSLPVAIDGVLGESVAYYAGASLGVVVAQGLNMIQAIEALHEVDVPRGRMRLVAGKDGIALLDDTYNSSPPAIAHALHTLGRMSDRKRKIAVLGDMLELGRFSDEEHREAGVLSAETADVLVTVGIRAKHMAQGALDAGFSPENIHSFDTAKDAGLFLKSFMQKNDVILVKGSQGVRMEHIVKMLMAYPEQAKEVLCRQEEEWLRKG